MRLEGHVFTDFFDDGGAGGVEAKREMAKDETGRGCVSEW